AGVSAIESGRAARVAVVGADALTRIIDFTDRSTCVLFGDGAGAVVLEATDEPGVLGIVLGADGSGADMLKVPAGGSARPMTRDALDARENFLTMNGSEVFRFAVKIIPRATNEALAASGLSVADLDWLVPHQANQRIIQTVEKRLGIAHDRVFSHVDRVGNTSAGSIPLALDHLYTSGQLAPGDLVALVGFGAGLTWGAGVVRWTMARPTKEA
ncbi:MAG: 3-oxoacyl-ACP synthase, partial [Coriobacteriia bacterium]|nr:3-oxoacyl-ACP synthase [Coriobacteriia bacterium]